MTFLLLIVGIFLWAAASGTAAHVGEALTALAGVLIALQITVFAILASIALRGGSSYKQRFF